MPHLSLDHNSHPLSSPLAGAWQNARFSPGLPLLACPCPHVPCIPTGAWRPGGIGQGNAKKDLFPTWEWRVAIKHLSAYLLWRLCTLRTPSCPLKHSHTDPLWNGKEFTEGHTQKLWEQIILRPHTPPTPEQRSWVTVGAAASTARGQMTSNLLFQNSPFPDSSQPTLFMDGLTLFSCYITFVWFCFKFTWRITSFSEKGEGREKERERNINVREIHWLVASHMHPDQGPNLKPRHVPWLKIEPITLHFAECCPTRWATPVRAWKIIFKTQNRNLSTLLTPISWVQDVTVLHILSL